MTDYSKVPDELKEFYGLTDGGPVALHPDLEAHMEDSTFGRSIKHPLVFSIIHGDILNKRINDVYEHKLKAVKEAEAKGEWGKYVWLHERPYRFPAFLEIEGNLNTEQYWKLLGEVWVDTENAHQNRYEWLYAFEGRDGKEHLLGEDEKAWYDVLPETLTVYRGFTLEHDDAVDGMSWTLDPKIALFFAKRFVGPDETACVASAEILKASIIGLFLGRGEDEVLLNAENLQDVNVVVADQFDTEGETQ